MPQLNLKKDFTVPRARNPREHSASVYHAEESKMALFPPGSLQLLWQN